MKILKRLAEQRYALKTITYRLYSFVILLVVFWAVDGNIYKALSFSLGIEVLKTIQYYFFERAYDSLDSRG